MGGKGMGGAAKGGNRSRCRAGGEQLYPSSRSRADQEA